MCRWPTRSGRYGRRWNGWAEMRSRLRIRQVLAVVAALLLVACAQGQPGDDPTPVPTITVTPKPLPGSWTATPTPTPSSTPTPSEEERMIAEFEASVDERWQFYDTDENAFHTSPWYAGAGKVMVPFGCSSAPWYASDPRCPGEQGFHHGTDVALPCGVDIRSAVDGEVVVGGLGDAYGSLAFMVRSGEKDHVIGHVSQRFVEAGDSVRKGDRIAINGADGAPDGCHLHFEVRPAGGAVDSAVDPAADLRLTGLG